MGNLQAISLGPGTLKTALLGTPEPASLTAPWDGGFIDLGYTFEGHAFKWTQETEEVEVAEELLPIDEIDTKQVGGVELILAEVTAFHFQLACNGGTILTPSGYVTFEPPLPGTVATKRMYGFESTDGTERIVWRKVRNAGELEMSRKKGADKAGIPLSLKLLSPGTGIPPWKWWGASPARV